MKKAFEEPKHRGFVPENYNVMGSIGAAILAKEAVEKRAILTLKALTCMKGTFSQGALNVMVVAISVKL